MRDETQAKTYEAKTYEAQVAIDETEPETDEMEPETELVFDHKEPAQEESACCGACGHGADVEAGRVPAHVRGGPLNVSMEEGAPALTIVVTHNGREETRWFEVASAKPGEIAKMVIGRLADNDIVLPKGNIGKRQCRVAVKDGRAIIVPFPGGCGTYLNGRKIPAPKVLHLGDQVYIGDFVLTFEPSEWA